MKSLLASLVVVLGLLGTTARAAEISGVNEEMKRFVAKQEIAGAVTVVAGKDKIIHQSAVGWADIEKKAPMKDDTIFWIASMTKPITGAAMMMLVEEGKVSIDDPIAKYIPEMSQLKTADGKPATVTIRHILTHTSGMGEATSAQTKEAKTLADLIPIFSKLPLKFEPGSKWEYCQSGINTAGRIIEIVSGQSLPDFFQNRLFAPLGMRDTTFYLTEPQAGRLATSYRLTDGKLQESPIFFLDGHPPYFRARYPAANGGLFSTGPDYARFCQMILNHGELDGKRYLKPESVKTMLSVLSGDVKTGFTPGNGWGLGWCIVRQPQGVTADLSPGSAGHGGAYGTQAWIDPQKGVAYVLMVQRANFPNSDASDVRKSFQHQAALAIQQK